MTAYAGCAQHPALSFLDPERPAHVSADTRRLDLARIHMLKAELGWDEDLYRDVMATVCGGIRSSAQLDITGRQRLLAHMQACKSRDLVKVPGKAPAKAARKPLSAAGKKLWSLWMQAADKGMVQHRSMAALNTWVQRQTGVERIEWLKGAQADLAIESLKKWVARKPDAFATEGDRA